MPRRSDHEMANIHCCRRLISHVQKSKDKLNRPIGSATTARIQAEISHLEINVRTLDEDLKQIQDRIDERHEEDHNNEESLVEESANRKLPNESQRDFLIRTGKITPFSKIPGHSLGRSESNLQDVLLDAEYGEPGDELVQDEAPVPETLSHRNLVQPGFAEDDINENTFDSPNRPERPAKRRRLKQKPTETLNSKMDRDDSPIVAESESERILSNDKEDAGFVPDLDDHNIAALYISDNDSQEWLEDDGPDSDTIPITGRKRKKESQDKVAQNEDLAGLDDGNEKLYQNRLRSWISRRSAARHRANAREILTVNGEDRLLLDSRITNRDDGSEAITRNNGLVDDESFLPHPTRPDTEFEGGYRIPGDIYPSLFDYQKTGVQWLWELYSQQVGGIVGDEMGLGKTIQVIAFLAGLHHSKLVKRPIIVVAPATVMKQWVNEFHTWWPPFRVSILHTSGSGMIDIGREAQQEDELMSLLPNTRSKPMTRGQKAAKNIVDRVLQDGHVLITTYSGLQTYAELLIPVDWQYAVLDEGHKIRNPNTAITIYCKELRTANRIILSGTPMQNNLVELWSLFDFVFPMRLGTLVNFRQQFEFPIRQGGYANASNLQVQTAMKCAETLKDTISPYLLQRFKADVASDLPKKSEQVLFCKLTKSQRETYENFLGSEDLKAIMNGKRQVLYGVDILRKICNHPDLVEHKTLSMKSGYKYGSGTKSGKMQVVKELLELWKEQGQKVLLFAQHRIMLDILERFIKSLQGFIFRRMDGNTPIRLRQGMVDEFNNNPDVHVFLLTTKVGGLGINLTGANRVIIYDPDWNPSTDVQARERAWRLGQKREVNIYRLMTAGTIEEKIYHRQLFKQFLTNKILRDPKQRQTFQMKDLHDLFTLGAADGQATETSELFKGTEVRFNDENGPEPLHQPVQTPNEGTSQTNNIESDHASSIPKMTGIVTMERFQGEEEEKHKADFLDGTNSEARVMESIFARSGVHSALEHDQIVNGKRVIAADPRIIEKEAKKVAAEAASELKKAGEVARTIPVGTPTWTGQFGTAGKPDHQSSQHRGFRHCRGGPASSSILAGLQNRQAANGSRASTLANAVARQNIPPGPRGTDFMKMIRDYLLTHGGKVHTQMLIDHFNRHCNTPQKTVEFKEMLKEIATLEKGSGGRGSWLLKDEYKP